MRFERCGRGHEVIFGFGFDSDFICSAEVNVIIIIPRWNGIENSFAGIDEGLIDSIDERSSSATDKDIIGLIIETAS